MSKTITISDEAAAILETLVRDGQFTDSGKAADEVILTYGQGEFDPEFIASLEEADRQIEAGLGVPLTSDLVRSIFAHARENHTNKVE